MYAYPHEKTFHLDEKTVKIILEFRGQPPQDEKLCECFVRVRANEFHNIAISNEDKEDTLLWLTNKKIT